MREAARSPPRRCQWLALLLEKANLFDVDDHVAGLVLDHTAIIQLHEFVLALDCGQATLDLNPIALGEFQVPSGFSSDPMTEAGEPIHLLTGVTVHSQAKTYRMVSVILLEQYCAVFANVASHV